MFKQFVSTAVKMVPVIFALFVVVGMVPVGGVGQTDSQYNASATDAEPNDSIVNATPIGYGRTVNATLSSPNDVDYYAVNATAGDGVVPRLHLQNMFDGSAIAVDIVAPSGTVRTETTNDAMGGPKNVAGKARPPSDPNDTAYTADTMRSGGTYYVRVQESDYADTNGNDTYEYSLNVSTEDLDQYDPNENGTTASALELGSEAEATLTGYDNDVYAFEADGGENYTVAITTTDGQLPKQLSVFDQSRLASDEYDYDISGAIAREDGFTDTAMLTFTAGEEGTYYVELTESTINNDLLEQSNYTFTVIEGDSSALPEDGDDDAEEDDDGSCVN